MSYLLISLAEAILWFSLGQQHTYTGVVIVLVGIGLAEGSTTAVFFSRVQSRIATQDIGRYFALLGSATDAATVLGVVLASAVVATEVGTWGPYAICSLSVVPLLSCTSILRLARSKGRA